nr:acriflavin resistance protein [uncultured Gammaproteobacteria bacterium]
MLAALIAAAIRRCGAVVAAALVLCLYAGWQLAHTGLDIFPEFAPKQVVIHTEAPGLTAEQVERRLTQPIEAALGGLLGLTALRSESIAGLSVVTVQFDDQTDLYRARQQVSERLASLALPPGASPPVQVPLASSSATILTFGLTGADLMRLRDWVDWTLVPRLRAVPGVADVNVFGEGRRQLQIQPDPERLIRFGLGLNALLSQLEQALSRHGLGFIETPNQRLELLLELDRDLPKRLGRLALVSASGVLTLDQVARIHWAPAPAISAAQIQGERGLQLMVIGQYGADTLTVSRAVEAALAEFAPLLAKQGIRLHLPLFRPADYIERALSNLGAHLLVGAGLVVAVLYAFLFDCKSALVSALAIPLSLLTAAWVLVAFGVKLNLMVLGGLAIALGEVADDAIIDVENIFRRLKENQTLPHPRPRAQVVLEASLEVRSSVVYASFIVALAFLPLLTLEGVAGRLFAPLGWAYIAAILASLGVALTVTPALGFLLLAKGQSAPSPLACWLQAYYAAGSAWILRHPSVSLAVAWLTCLAALASLPQFQGRFLPNLREGHFIVHTTSLPGTSLEASLHLGKQLTQAFLDLPQVISVAQWAGRAERGADTYGSHYSEYEVRLKPLSGKEQQQTLNALKQILNRFPGLTFEANTFLVERVDETLSGYPAPIVIHLYGPDLAELDRLAQRVAELIRPLPGVDAVRIRAQSSWPQLRIEPRVEALTLWGVSPAALGKVLAACYQGWPLGETYQGNRSFPIALILPPKRRTTPAALDELPIQTPSGTLLPLKQLAAIRQTEGRYNVLHRSAQRVQTVTVSASGDTDRLLSRIKREVQRQIDFPPGYYPEFTGAAVEQGQARQALIANALLAGGGGLILIYLALGSLRHTLLTLVNLPFALAGGVAAAWLQGGVLSLGSLVGFVTLFGITVRNAIMLIAHYRHLVEHQGLPWNQTTAVQGALDRLPAVLMTALVTALAMLPIALASDNPGREIMGPMAGIVVGGLMSSTCLTLLLLPQLMLRFGRFPSQKRNC